ncbi:hypothetical protein RRG08_028939 [Elysia crispata]|uniref:Uncharacterized protein n=1 Tax=Elysia crispata TaxID=231223 RepID=A0AAE1E2E6_9GAST|nr:hypothetical protein RRG08_028939 [Elysia crispata]
MRYVSPDFSRHFHQTFHTGHWTAVDDLHQTVTMIGRLDVDVDHRQPDPPSSCRGTGLMEDNSVPRRPLFSRGPRTRWLNLPSSSLSPSLWHLTTRALLCSSVATISNTRGKTNSTGIKRVKASSTMDQ